MKDVEYTIKTQEENIVCSYVLDFFQFVYHKKLG